MTKMHMENTFFGHGDVHAYGLDVIIGVISQLVEDFRGTSV
jgi:hypothetical protein